MLIRCATPTDHSRLVELWQRTPGIRLRAEDAFAPFCAYLARNPELSLVGEIEGQVMASLLIGHDGRRGYLQHLVVDHPWRDRGFARDLLEKGLAHLAGLGINKSHVFVLSDAPQALSFWQRQQGWQVREDIQIFSTRSEA